jgi:hypothetical protein
MSTWGDMYRKHDVDNYIVYYMYIFHLFFKIARENADAKNAKNVMV